MSSIYLAPLFWWLQRSALSQGRAKNRRKSVPEGHRQCKWIHEHFEEIFRTRLAKDGRL